jgi:hypothetical protein
MRSPLLVLLMLVALVGAGCGGDDGGGAGKTTSNEDYGKQLAQAGQTLQKTFSDIGDESGSSSTQIANRLDQAAKAIDDFQAITPPPAAKAAHAKIISGLQDIADVCRQGADAARKKDSAGLAKALKGLSAGSGLAKITEAQKELQAKGITVTTASGG